MIPDITKSSIFTAARVSVVVTSNKQCQSLGNAAGKTNAPWKIASLMKATYAMCKYDYFGDKGYSSIIAFPLSTSGILMTSGMLLTGIKIIFSSDMSPVRYLELIDYWNAASMAAPPAYYEAILALPHLHAFDVSSITNIMTGMDFFSQSLLSRLKSKFANIRSAANGYGLVETSLAFMLWKKVC